MGIYFKTINFNFVFRLLIIHLLFLIHTNSFSENNRFFSTLKEKEGNNEIKKEINQPPKEFDYYQSNYLRYGDFVYVNNIKTVLFNREGWEFSVPVIELNASERLTLKFDDLNADFNSYAYTIIHCNALWEPSELRDYEYIEGFTQDQITQYAFSRNTRVPFTNYKLVFPNNNMRPRVSGNYILKVYEENNPDNIVLTRRFMVFEQRVSIEANIRQAINLNYRDEKQQIDFTILTGGYRISNPYRDLRVVITQNGRWDNAIIDLQPRLVQGNNLIYDFERGNLFDGGNEFRNFDTRSLRHRSLRVEEINSISQGWEVFLKPDRNRRFMRYTTDGDINGRFKIETQDYNDNTLETDYVWVHFTLPHSNFLSHGNVYILGALSDWNFTKENKMSYNFRDSRYEHKMLLKQGFYNYQYAFLEDQEEIAEVGLFEGNHSVAENDYTILVYYRRPGDIYDSLIGLRHYNSHD